MAPVKSKRIARFPLLLNAIKAHSGTWLSADELIMHAGIEERRAGIQALGSFRTICERDKMPLEVKGTGDNKLYRWNESDEADGPDGVDALVVLRFGDKQSTEFKIEHARQIYLQLHRLFGGEGKK